MTQAVQVAQYGSSGVSLGFKNRIINGAMVIDQRGSASSPVTVGSRAYAVDRWCAEKAGTSGVFTFGQSSVAPAGFTNSFLCTVTTADSSLGANDIGWFEHHIEGYNIADLGWGTANAQTVTLSFWARSSLTGTYSIVAQGGPNYSANYTINAANTWEYKTITIPGPTSGSWNTTNSTGFKIRFALMVGSNYQLAPGTWTSGDYIGSTSQVNWMATNGNTFYITGVQLEEGSQATSFEYRPYTTELQLCQRYCYQISYNTINAATILCPGTQNSGGDARGMLTFPVTMRASPTTSAPTGSSYYGYDKPGSGFINFNTMFFAYGAPNGCLLYASVTGGTTGYGVVLYLTAPNSYVRFEAEL